MLTNFLHKTDILALQEPVHQFFLWRDPECWCPWNLQKQLVSPGPISFIPSLIGVIFRMAAEIDNFVEVAEVEHVYNVVVHLSVHMVQWQTQVRRKSRALWTAHPESLPWNTRVPCSATAF
jgi:hypothetical protein